MRRRVFTILSALSLLLCVATVVLWVRSYHVTDAVCVEYAEGMATHSDYAVSETGGITFYDGVALHPSQRPVRFYYEDMTHAPRWTRVRIGFDVAGVRCSTCESPFWAATGLRIPHWFVPVVTAIVPLCWAIRRAFPRYPPGCCRRCGYDLRATPGRCPECGTAVERGKGNV